MILIWHLPHSDEGATIPISVNPVAKDKPSQKSAAELYLASTLSILLSMYCLTKHENQD